MGNVKDGKDGVRGLDELKNQSRKCEGPDEGSRRDKKPKWKMRRIGTKEGDQ
jgi:hypothetical protein